MNLFQTAGLFLITLLHVVPCCNSFSTGNSILTHPNHAVHNVSPRTLTLPTQRRITSVPSSPHNVSPFVKIQSSNTRKTMSTSSSTSLQMSMGVSSVLSTIREVTKSSSSGIHVISDIALNTPPFAYFLALLSAGIGVPVSEDALCIVVGYILKQCDTVLRWKFIWSLYLGVVFSDIITFWLGRALRVGLLEPLRKLFNLGGSKSSGDTSTSTTTTTKQQTLPMVPKKRKRDRMMAKIEQSGDYIGFVVRLSVGIRGPMMLLTGFTNKVPFVKFVVGTLLGATVSLPVQLAIGYFMSQSFAAAQHASSSVTSKAAVVASTELGWGAWMASLLSRKLVIGGAVGVVVGIILLSQNVSFLELPFNQNDNDKRDPKSPAPVSP